MSFLNFLKINTDRAQVVFEVTSAASEPGPRFYIMVAVSTLIACFGLVANSTAVVIGAMLVAPLMTPIFGISLALVYGDSNLFRNAFRAEVVGVIAAIAMGFLVGMLLSLGNPFSNATPEMLARTKPNLFDLIVAVLSGFAGTYALIDEKISPALPGVAIATAIVPPLATCGLCLSFGAYQGALGAFLLFLSNFLSILIVAAFLFIKSGMIINFDKIYHRDIIRKFGWAIICFVLIATFLANTLFKMIQQRRFYGEVSRVLTSEFTDYPATGIERILIEKKREQLFVLAKLHSPSQLTPEQVSDIEKKLAAETDIPTQLIVRISKTSDVSSSGSNSTIVAQGLDGFFISREGNPVVYKIRLAEQAIREYLDDHLGLDLLDVDYLDLKNGETILAMITGIRGLSRSEIAELEILLRQRTNDSNLDLIVRFIRVDLYDKTGPLRLGWTTLISPTDAQRRIADSLSMEIRAAFADNKTHLLEKINTTITNDAYVFLIEISGSAPYLQDHRKRLYEHLTSLTDYPITLHVWVNQGAVLTDHGLIPFDVLTEQHIQALGETYNSRLEQVLKSAR